MKVHLTWVALALVLRAVCTLAGDVKERADERAAWNRELQTLKREKPSEYTKMQTTFTFLAELILAELGYGTGPFKGVLDEKTQNALRAYERNRGLLVTGDPLSFETVEQLRVDREAYNYRPVSLPSLYVFTDLWESGYVSARGTWVISGEQMALPEQTSRIDCHRHFGTCTEATAIVSADGDNRHLSVNIDTYEIESWDKHEIITKPLQFECTRYIRRVNRAQKSITGIRSTTSNEDTCKAIDRSEKHLVMTKGFKVYWELEQARQKKWRELLQISPELIKVLESGSTSKME